MNGINTGIGETTISRGFIACLAIVLLAQHAVAQRVSVRPGRTGIIPPLTTEGHPFRYRLPVRPLNYLVTPDPNDPSQRAFTNASPLAATWVRAGTDLNRTLLYGSTTANAPPTPCGIPRSDVGSIPPATGFGATRTTPPTGSPPAPSASSSANPSPRPDRKKGNLSPTTARACTSRA
jgi:hypothetical protein